MRPPPPLFFLLCYCSGGAPACDPYRTQFVVSASFPSRSVRSTAGGGVVGRSTQSTQQASTIGVASKIYGQCRTETTCESRLRAAGNQSRSHMRLVSRVFTTPVIHALRLKKKINSSVF